MQQVGSRQEHKHLLQTAVLLLTVTTNRQALYAAMEEMTSIVAFRVQVFFSTIKGHILTAN
jgi:hypothetical protein